MESRRRNFLIVAALVVAGKILDALVGDAVSRIVDSALGFLKLDGGVVIAAVDHFWWGALATLAVWGIFELSYWQSRRKEAAKAPPIAILRAPKRVERPTAPVQSQQVTSIVAKADVQEAATRSDQSRAKDQVHAKRQEMLRGWSKVSSFELHEAASLWVNESPQVNYLLMGSEGARACLARLKAAILDQVLIPEPDAGSLASLAQFARNRTIDGRARVRRENLRAYAEAEGERPLFLFVED